MVRNFMEGGVLSHPLEPEFVEATRESFADMVKVVMTAEEMKAVLLDDGLPEKPAEMKQRFEKYLDTLAKGCDMNQVRVALE